MALSSQAKEQELILDEAKANVSVQAFEMKRCLDKNKLMDGLKHASIMLSELKTANLTPKYYYELYTAIADEMRHLQLYLLEEYRKGRRVEDLYELVQYAGNILPRLYLLVTVGVVYIQTEEQQQFVRDILRDMVEMCRGMQHPLRGLFLRNYLIQTTKNILPQNMPTALLLDSSNSCENGDANGDDGDTAKRGGSMEGVPIPRSSVHDSIDYILMNFTEMNKLWVRMQYQGHTKDRHLREQERRDLKQLVGANLYALSSLENLTVQIYKNKVLPIVLAQIVNSKDAIAQEYLMEVIIHVFPDEFHVATLQVYLDACSTLHEDVDMNSIITTLIKRLTAMATQEDNAGDGSGTPTGIPAELELFSVFSEKIEQIIKTRPRTPLEKIIGMQASLLSLALKCYSDKPEYVNIVLMSTNKIFNNFDIDKLMAKSNVANELVSLLKLPVDHYNDLLLVADMAGFAPLLNFLDWEPRKDTCTYLIENALQHGCIVSDVEKTNKVLDLLQTLYKHQPDAPEDESLDLTDMGGVITGPSSRQQQIVEPGFGMASEVETDTCLLVKLLHNFHSDDPNIQYLMLQAAKEHLAADVKGTGGQVKRQYTLPALIFIALQLALRFKAISQQDEMWGKKCHKILGSYCRHLIDKLVADEKGELALRLFLQCALVVNQLPFEQNDVLAYEFFSQALALYEDAMTESRAQFAAIQLIMCTLQRMTCFTEENHEPLRTQCTLSASKLFKKPDQARAVAQSAHLYWDCSVADIEDKPLREGKRVADCLKRSVKTASQVLDAGARTQIYAEMLDHYIHYFVQPQCTSITATVINQIIAKIRQELEENVTAADDKARLKRHIDVSMKHLKEKKDEILASAAGQENGEESAAAKFAELALE